MAVKRRMHGLFRFWRSAPKEDSDSLSAVWFCMGIGKCGKLPHCALAFLTSAKDWLRNDQLSSCLVKVGNKCIAYSDFNGSKCGFRLVISGMISHGNGKQWRVATLRSRFCLDFNNIVYFCQFSSVPAKRRMHGLFLFCWWIPVRFRRNDFHTNRKVWQAATPRDWHFSSLQTLDWIIFSLRPSLWI